MIIVRYPSLIEELFVFLRHRHRIYIMENKDLNRIKVMLAEKKRTNKWLAEQLGKDPATISKKGYKCLSAKFGGPYRDFKITRS